MKTLLSTLLLGALFLCVAAQAPLYGQCGGTGWTGSTTCVSGATCVYSNEYYSQCVPSSSSTTKTPTTSSTTNAPAATGSGSFSNPILWHDLSDLDIIRVNDTFYYSASTFHHSPGAPILRSYDLVNWEYIGHSVPTLDWSDKYSLISGQRAYVKGIWASSLKYRKSNGLFYYIACIEFSKSYMYTAPSATGPWTKRATYNKCYYDAGLLIDDSNDTMYVAYGSTTINVAQLSADGFSEVRSQAVWSDTSIGYIEGSRFYRINGSYYIFLMKPGSPVGEYVIKSSSPFGSYTARAFVKDVGSPIPGGGTPSPGQGGIVDTPDGRWYYMGFVGAYPGGRQPCMIPITFNADGFPTPNLVNGKWAGSYPNPLPTRPVKVPGGTDTFSSQTLGAEWEWNHNPDTSKFSLGSGLKLSTATVTFDLYAARNTLTHRIYGPSSTGTIVLDYSSMKAGDRAGLVLLRDRSGWVGIKKDGDAARIVVCTGLDLEIENWTTANTGAEVAAGAALPSTGKIWLRVAADVRPANSTATFSYSTDGSSYTRLGPTFSMYKDWHYFLGYRFGIFNYATTALGGSVTVPSFTISQP